MEETTTLPEPEQKQLTPDEIAVERFLCTYILPDAKKDDFVTYSDMLSRKHPTMSPDRRLRKAAEYFKLKKISSILPK